ncbi:hypothetical protein MSIMFI_05480 [Mycobacterium simulans]|nr:hypothetical protein MSIMFI_05480 [Mycobacterium simulans]
MSAAVAKGELRFGGGIAEAGQDVNESGGGVVGVDQPDPAGVFVLRGVDQRPGRRVA